MGRSSKTKKSKAERLNIDFGSSVDEALKKAFASALMKHKQADIPVAVWRGGKIVILKPEDIPV